MKQHSLPLYRKPPKKWSWRERIRRMDEVTARLKAELAKAKIQDYGLDEVAGSLLAMGERVPGLALTAIADPSPAPYCEKEIPWMR